MTVYAGETVQLFVEGTDFDTETVLSDADISEIVITIYDAAEEVVLAETAADWVSERSGWELNWDTSAVDPGTYQARIEARGTGATPAVSIEFKRVRLNRQRVGA